MQGNDRARSGRCYRTTHDWAAGGRITRTIVEAVAEVRGREPASGQPLNEVLDPDALDRLFRSRSTDDQPGDVRVEFVFGGCEVTVTGAGEVEARSLL
jgi:hypothetical protein